MDDQFLIVGLGNPGPQYERTRHNLGFLAVDRFADKCKAAVDFRMRKNAQVAEVRDGGRRLVLCKPQTFMNLSGEAAAPLMRFFQIPLKNVLIVYDELDLPLGRIKLLGKGSAGGHNGMKSLIAHFGTQEFARLRLGIGPKPPQWDGADFVLSRFAKEELPLVAEVIERAADGIRAFIDNGVERAMNQVNSGDKGTV